MREDTIWRKKASRLFQEMWGRSWLGEQVGEIISQGKRGLDGLVLELGRMVAEAIMYMEREEIAGPDYRPYRSEVLREGGLREGGQIFHYDINLAPISFAHLFSLESCSIFSLSLFLSRLTAV